VDLLDGDPPNRSLHVCIFTPSPHRRGRRLPAGSLAVAVERLILDISDGMIILRGRGVWRDKRGRVLCESVVVFENYIPGSMTQVAWSSFLQQLRILANEWREDAILVVVDGCRILIPGARHPRVDLSVYQFPRSWWGRATR
jgi:hypothetical protein